MTGSTSQHNDKTTFGAAAGDLRNALLLRPSVSELLSRAKMAILRATIDNNLRNVGSYLLRGILWLRKFGNAWRR